MGRFLSWPNLTEWASGKAGPTAGPPVSEAPRLAPGRGSCASSRNAAGPLDEPSRRHVTAAPKPGWASGGWARPGGPHHPGPCPRCQSTLHHPSTRRSLRQGEDCVSPIPAPAPPAPPAEVALASGAQGLHCSLGWMNKGTDVFPHSGICKDLEGRPPIRDGWTRDAGIHRFPASPRGWRAAGIR